MGRPAGLGVVLCIALLCALAGCGPSPEDDAAGLREVFDAYRQALADGRADDAAALFSSESLAPLATSRDLALYATRPELDAAEPVDLMFALILRVRSNAEDVAAMNPRDVAALLIQQRGMIGAEFDAASTLDAIEIEGDRATANHVKHGRVVRRGLRFVREREGWRQDLGAVREQMAADIERMGGGKRRQLYSTYHLVEIATGVPLHASHFEPLARRPAQSKTALR